MGKKRELFIPEYLKYAAGDAWLNSDEVAKIFGYANKASLANSLASGHAEDLKKIMHYMQHVTGNTPLGFKQSCHWRVGDIRKLVRKIRAEAAQ